MPHVLLRASYVLAKRVGDCDVSEAQLIRETALGRVHRPRLSGFAATRTAPKAEGLAALLRSGLLDHTHGTVTLSDDLRYCLALDETVP